MRERITDHIKNVTSSWAQTISILATVVLCSYTMYGEMKRIESRLDQQIANSNEAFVAQSQRTDKLYEMFIDLLKEQRK